MKKIYPILLLCLIQPATSLAVITEITPNDTEWWGPKTIHKIKPNIKHITAKSNGDPFDNPQKYYPLLQTPICWNTPLESKKDVYTGKFTKSEDSFTIN